MLVIALYLWDDWNSNKWPQSFFFWFLGSTGPVASTWHPKKMGNSAQLKVLMPGAMPWVPGRLGSGWCLDVLRTNSLISLVCSNGRVSRVSWKATDPMFKNLSHVQEIHVRLTNHLDQLNQLKDGEAYIYWWILLNGCQLDQLDQPTKLRNVRTEMSQRTKLQLGAIAGDMPPKTGQASYSSYGFVWKWCIPPNGSFKNGKMMIEKWIQRCHMFRRTHITIPNNISKDRLVMISLILDDWGYPIIT